MFRKTTKERHGGKNEREKKEKKEKKKKLKKTTTQNASVHHKMKRKKKERKKPLKKYNETHASTAPATNKSRRTPLCRCEVLQIIKLIDCLKDLTVSKKKKR